MLQSLLNWAAERSQLLADTREREFVAKRKAENLLDEAAKEKDILIQQLEADRGVRAMLKHDVKITYTCIEEHAVVITAEDIREAFNLPPQAELTVHMPYSEAADICHDNPIHAQWRVTGVDSAVHSEPTKGNEQ